MYEYGEDRTSASFMSYFLSLDGMVMLFSIQMHFVLQQIVFVALHFSYFI